MRSLELDTRQWSATQLALMVALGNQRVNTCYYARPPPCDEATDATSVPRSQPGLPVAVRTNTGTVLGFGPAGDNTLNMPTSPSPMPSPVQPTNAHPSAHLAHVRQHQRQANAYCSQHQARSPNSCEAQGVVQSSAVMAGNRALSPAATTPPTHRS